MLPNVTIEISGNSLGRVATVTDTVSALVLSGVAATSLAQNAAARIYNVAGAEALGITFATHPHAYTQISDFFSLAGNEAELWIMLVADTTTQAAICAANGPLQKLIAASAGRVTIAGFSMKRAGGYSPGTAYFDYDVAAVAALAQTIATSFANAYAPCAIILEGSYLSAAKFDTGDVLPTVINLGDRVSIFCGASNSGDRHCCMGRFFGWLAAETVEVHPAMVKRGAFLGQGYLTTGIAIEKYTEGQISSLNTAGIITLRWIVGYGGAYISDDPTLAATTSDFTSLARRRVMDKGHRLTYVTYIGELNEVIDLDDEGKIKPSQVAYLQNLIQTALTLQMVAAGNITAVRCYINPAQNVLANDRVDIEVFIRPKGYSKFIKIKLGFENPAISS